jgi:hypothetical protein
MARLLRYGLWVFEGLGPFSDRRIMGGKGFDSLSPTPFERAIGIRRFREWDIGIPDSRGGYLGHGSRWHAVIVALAGTGC